MDEELRKKFTPRVITRLVWYASDDAWSLYYGQKNAIRETIRKVHEAYKLAEVSYALADRARKLANDAQGAALNAIKKAEDASKIADSARSLASQASEIAAHARQQVQALESRIAELNSQVAAAENALSSITSEIEGIINRLRSVSDAFSRYADDMSRKASEALSEVNAIKELIGDLGRKIQEIVTEDVGYVVIDIGKAKCGATKYISQASGGKYKGMLAPSLGGVVWNMMCAHDCLKKMDVIKAAEYFMQSSTYLWNTLQGLVATLDDVIDAHEISSDLAATMERAIRETVDVFKSMANTLAEVVEKLSGVRVPRVTATEKKKKAARSGVRAKLVESQKIYTKEEAMRKRRPPTGRPSGPSVVPV